MPTNQYGLTEFDADPETAAELRKLRRQEEMAKAMMARGQQPLQGQMVGGVYVRPSMFQGIANLANAYSAGKQNEAVDKGYGELAQRRSAKEQAAVDALMSKIQGTPESVEQLPEGVFGPPQVTPAVPASPEQRQTALMKAMLGSSPKAQKAGAMLYKLDQDAQTRKDAVQARMDELKYRIAEGRITKEEADARAADLRREMQEAGFAQQKSMAQLTALFRQPREQSAPVAVIGPDGKPVLVSRSDAIGKTPAAMDAETQGAISGAKQAGEAKAKRALNMAGLGETSETARGLLSGTSGKPLPTGSGIGTLYDSVAGLVGASPEGAKESQTMKAIGGALTSKMPRMDGPQSDKDTKLYKEMAAVVGDSTVPVERRLAALGVVESLWGKYEVGATQPKQSGGLSPQEQAELDQLRARFKK